VKPKHSSERAQTGPLSPEQTVAAIIKQLEGISFGSLLITVHDGKIVQFERIQKTRLF
jgi:hypothetical protein